MNLFTKILFSVLGTCLIIFVAVIGFNMYATGKLAMDNAEQITTVESEKQAKIVEVEFNNAMNILRTLETTLGTMVVEDNPDRELANGVLRKILEENEQFLGTWTIWEPNAFDGKDAAFANTALHDETGRFIPFWSRSGEDIVVNPVTDYEDPEVADFYFDPMTSGQEVVMEPFVYPVGDEEIMITALVAPIIVDGKRLGVVGIDFSLEFMQELNDQIKLYDNGFGSIITHDGTFIAHPSTELIGNSMYDVEELSEVETIESSVETGETLSLIGHSPGIKGDAYKVYSPINIGVTETPWSLMVTVPVAEVKQQSNQLFISSIIIGLIGMAILTIVLIFITRGLVKPIKKLLVQTEEIANGNLIDKEFKIKSKDEIGQLGIAIHTMAANLRKVIQQISNVSETVTGQSEELTQSANEVMTGSKQISTTMQEIATGSETQASNAGDLSASMGDFTTKVNHSNDQGELIRHASENVLNQTHNGVSLMESSSAQMERIDGIVHDAVKKVEGLDMHTQQISELVSIIQDIAEQTNLLALNAAIEAARAGEHGKGFAVVADEVRKLAEQSSGSVTNITNLINNIKNESNEVTTSLKDGYKEVEQGTNQIISTGEMFHDISTSVTEMVNSIQTVSANLSDIAEHSQEMNSSIQEIAAISEESAAGVEETTASAEETSSVMEEVATSSKDLSELAEELDKLVRQFKI